MSHRVRTWDLPVRVSHWAMAALVLVSYGTAEWGWLSMQWHFYSGYALLVVLVFRLIWAIVGSEHARFVDFVRGPSRIVQHVRDWRTSPPHAGHNALGGWAVLVLWLLLLIQLLTGLMTGDDADWFGPLFDRVPNAWTETATNLHHSTVTLLLWGIGIHVVAVLLYLLLRRDNLIVPMLTGRRELPDDVGDARWAPLSRAIVVLAIAVAVVWGVVGVYGTA